MADVDRNAVKQSRSTGNKVDEASPVYSKNSSCQYNHPQKLDMPIKESLEQMPETQLMLSMHPTTPSGPPCWVLKPPVKEAVQAFCTFSVLSVPATSLQTERGPQSKKLSKLSVHSLACRCPPPPSRLNGGNKTCSCLKFGRYDSRSSYEAFQKKTELVAEVNGWDEVERVGQPTAASDGDAQQVLLDV
ncbi:hypothetical protein Q8A67_005548 [Cirrhinus molitorella]|uniref:Uncharacterized protein n=1 Tax=Cirrhinus molitorella TaxID=172907 RepID=A0AA88TSR2_9TELE|nr:hypothetical protein Q8A67_005548 [Cirrhinus molitorella]